MIFTRLAPFLAAAFLLGCSSEEGSDSNPGTGGTGGSGTGGSGTGGSGTGGSGTGGSGTGGSAGSNPQPPPTSCTSAACAFPGAEGFGTDTGGGRGGKVIVVT